MRQVSLAHNTLLRVLVTRAQLLCHNSTQLNTFQLGIRIQAFQATSWRHFSQLFKTFSHFFFNFSKLFKLFQIVKTFLRTFLSFSSK